MMKLTLAELEATTCARLTGFLPLDFARVTGKEACGFEGGTVGLAVDLAKCAGDSEPYCLSLTFRATTSEGDLDVKLTCCTGDLERLVHDITERSVGKIVLELAAVDDDVTFTGNNINTSDS